MLVLVLVVLVRVAARGASNTNKKLIKRFLCARTSIKPTLRLHRQQKPDFKTVRSFFFVSPHLSSHVRTACFALFLWTRQISLLSPQPPSRQSLHPLRHPQSPPFPPLQGSPNPLTTIKETPRKPPWRYTPCMATITIRLGLTTPPFKASRQPN